MCWVEVHVCDEVWDAPLGDEANNEWASQPVILQGVVRKLVPMLSMHQRARHQLAPSCLSEVRFVPDVWSGMLKMQQIMAKSLHKVDLCGTSLLTYRLSEVMALRAVRMHLHVSGDLFFRHHPTVEYGGLYEAIVCSGREREGCGMRFDKCVQCEFE